MSLDMILGMLGIDAETAEKIKQQIPAAVEQMKQTADSVSHTKTMVSMVGGDLAKLDLNIAAGMSHILEAVKVVEAKQDIILSLLKKDAENAPGTNNGN